MNGQPLLIHAMQCLFAALSTLEDPVAGATMEGPKIDPVVVVRALRFSEEPASYSFMVTNNGTKPISSIVLGMGHSPVVKASFDTVPTSVASPRGWTGQHVFAHESPWITYRWRTEDPKAWIQPRQSLSGFSVQLAIPRGDLLDEDADPVDVDLMEIPFSVGQYDGRSVVGIVEADWTPDSRMPPTSSSEALP